MRATWDAWTEWPGLERVEGGVALTFDDGPDPDSTPAVLDALTGRPGGVAGWLGEHGWTSADTDRLRAKLLV